MRRVCGIRYVRLLKMSGDPNVLPAVDLMKQRNEAMAELVKALLIINGGGAVALLAFLQAIWGHSRATLAQPTVLAIALLSAGALLAASCHLFRHQASWYHQSGRIAMWKWFRRGYLTSAALSLGAFASGVCIVVIGVLRAL